MNFSMAREEFLHNKQRAFGRLHGYFSKGRDVFVKKTARVDDVNYFKVSIKSRGKQVNLDRLLADAFLYKYHETYGVGFLSKGFVWEDYFLEAIHRELGLGCLFNLVLE